MEQLYNPELHRLAHRVVDILMEYATNNNEWDEHERYLVDLRWKGFLKNDYLFEETIFHKRLSEGFTLTIDTTNCNEPTEFGVPKDLLTPWGIWQPIKTGGLWGMHYKAWNKVFPEIQERLGLEPINVQGPKSNIHLPEIFAFAITRVDGINLPAVKDLGFIETEEAKDVKKIWDQMQQELRGELGV